MKNARPYILHWHTNSLKIGLGNTYLLRIDDMLEMRIELGLIDVLVDKRNKNVNNRNLNITTYA